MANISPKPQSWRYISFSTAEKSPCEQCVKIVYKLHQDTLEKTFFISVHHLVPFKLKLLMKLERQLTQVGANNNGSSPRWWQYACACLKLEWIVFHIVHRWNICCQSFVPFESHTIYGKTRLQTTTFIWNTNDKCRCYATFRKSLKVHMDMTHWRNAFCMWTMH